MPSFSLDEVIQVTGGTMVTPSSSKRIRRVCTDSRIIRPGDLFIALDGPQFDGHRFVKAAVKGGAIGAIVKRSAWRKVSAALGPMRQTHSRFRPFLIGVDDPLAAYQDLAGFYRSQFSIPVVAITGSNGKTTTKEMVSHTLARRWRILKTQGNFNNKIGVPHTLFGLNRRHQAAVIEMGVDQEGQTTRLCEMAKPTLGVITNVGPDHLEFFGTVESSARAKAELLKNLPNDGVVILNADDDYFGRFSKQANCSVLSYGLSSKSDVRASDIEFDHDGTRFRLSLPRRKRTKKIHIQLAGHHNVSNALAGAAVGYALGLSGEEVAAGLAKVQPAPMRSQIRRWKGVTFLYDCYNANPASMNAAVTMLADLGREKRTIAVLGDMRELGPEEDRFHEEVGSFVAKQGISHFIACGKFGRNLAHGARDAGMAPSKISLAKNVSDAARTLKRLVSRGDVILLKASRGARIERVLESLVPSR